MCVWKIIMDFKSSESYIFSKVSDKYKHDLEKQPWYLSLSKVQSFEQYINQLKIECEISELGWIKTSNSLSFRTLKIF